MAKRNLYLKTVSVSEAYDKYFTYLNEKGIIKNEVERISTYDSLDRITSEALYAKCNSPLFNASAMDGICVDSTRTKKASEENPVFLKLCIDYKIVDTGDPIKPPFDSVIMAEDVIVVDDETVKIINPVAGWDNVRPIGEDVVAGEMILGSNHMIKPIDIGALVASGVLEINVYKKMTVGVIPTGDEIINPVMNPKEGDIIDSNSYMLKALVDQNYGIGVRYDIVEDDYDKIKNALINSINKNDMTIINAGSSAGTEDFTVHILKELGEVIVHGVSMKPGKPVILAVVNGKPVIGLPGYPLSAYLAFDLFVRPILMKVVSHDEFVEAYSSNRIVSSLKYQEYVRVKLGKVDSKYVASPLHRGAASQMSMVKADGILVIPQNSEGIEFGEKAEVKLIKSRDEIDNTLVSIGSHDILMDLIADLLNKNHSKTTLSSTHVGSMGGLLALKRGETLIAPTHLLDEKTGVYNIDILREIFGEGKVSLIKGVDRIQGIMVKKGNPLNIKSLNDLTRCKFINRQRGSGTRVLLDFKLKTLGIDSDSIDGYDKEVATHMLVAAAVASPYVDCGIGIKAVADSMNLDFIEVGIEEYDFALLTKNLEDAKVKDFIEMIQSKELHDKMIEIGGYGFSHVGEIINI